MTYLGILHQAPFSTNHHIHLSIWKVWSILAFRVYLTYEK